MEHPIYRVPRAQGLDSWLLSFCTPMAPIPPAVPCLTLGTSDGRVPRPKPAVGSSHQPLEDDCVQDIMPWSLGKRCPATLVWVCTHCSSRFLLIRAAQETHVMLLRLPTPPRLPARGKEVPGSLRAGCPGHRGRLLPLVPRTLSVPPPSPRRLHSCSHSCTRRVKPTSSLTISPGGSLFFCLLCLRFSSFATPWQPCPQVGTRSVLFCTNSSE